VAPIFCPLRVTIFRGMDIAIPLAAGFEQSGNLKVILLSIIFIEAKFLSNPLMMR